MLKVFTLNSLNFQSVVMSQFYVFCSHPERLRMDYEFLTKQMKNTFFKQQKEARK